jgi:hypothetical protein
LTLPLVTLTSSYRNIGEVALATPQQSSPIDLAKERWRYAQAASLTHFHLGDWYRPINYVLGGLAVVASAVVAAGLFTTINADGASSSAKNWAAGVAAFAAALTALTSFLGLGALGEKHRQSGAAFEDIGRALDILIAHPGNDEESWKALEAIDAKISNIESNALGYPGHIYRRNYRNVGQWVTPPRDPPPKKRWSPFGRRPPSQCASNEAK